MEIVFVHFNSPIPKFLEENIKTCIKSFPTNLVTLIVNNGVKVPGIADLKVVNYQVNENWRKLENLLDHPKDFRNNFWMTSISRFLAIADYMETNDHEIIHVESDVILSSDFPFKEFSNIPSPISYPVVSKLRGVASTVYFRDKTIAKKLARFSLECIEEDSRTSDMLILRKFYDRYPELVTPLPFGPIDLDSYQHGIDDQLLQRSIATHSILGGIFDGSDIGVYYFGTDPRNHRGISSLRVPIPESLANYSKWLLKNDQHRIFPNLGTTKERSLSRVYSLHMTNKHVSLFRIHTQGRIILKRIKESQNNPAAKVYFWVLYKQTWKSIIRRLKKGSTFSQ